MRTPSNVSTVRERPASTHSIRRRKASPANAVDSSMCTRRWSAQAPWPFAVSRRTSWRTPQASSARAGSADEKAGGPALAGSTRTTNARLPPAAKNASTACARKPASPRLCPPNWRWKSPNPVTNVARSGMPRWARPTNAGRRRTDALDRTNTSRDLFDVHAGCQAFSHGTPPWSRVVLQVVFRVLLSCVEAGWS